MDEKRRDPRFKSDQKLWCEGQDVKSEAVARDVSRGGIAIVTDRVSEVGSQMKVSFVTPEEGRKVSVNMEVVWHNKKPEGGPTAMGLRIVKFEKGQNAFDRFVARHLDDNQPRSGSKPKRTYAAKPAHGESAEAGAEACAEATPDGEAKPNGEANEAEAGAEDKNKKDNK